MAHLAQRNFCRSVKDRYPDWFRKTRVLEVGSRNVNGSLRELFLESVCYVGIDAEPGPDVDVVCFAHEFTAELESFDVVCSAETFEHDPHAAQTVYRMLQLLRPGGLFFMTCAGEGRPEHGTTRTGNCYGPNPDFYSNGTAEQFQEWADISEGQFQEHTLQHNRSSGDLYFCGIKS